VAVEIFEGNTGDPKTVAAQVKNCANALASPLWCSSAIVA